MHIDDRQRNWKAWNHMYLGCFNLDRCWLTTCRKKITPLVPKQHLPRFNFRLTNLSLSRTNLKCSKWSLQSLLWMLTSSTKILRNWLVHSLNNYAIVREKTFVVFFNPNGITFHSKSLNLVITTVLQISSSAMLICPNFNWRLKVENHEDFPSCINTSFINGIGKESHLVYEFKTWSLPHNLWFPSFFTRSVTL